MRKVDSFGMIDCQLVKHDEAQKVLKECITSVKADLTSKGGSRPFLMLPVYAPISAASRSGTRRRGGDVVPSTSKVSVAASEAQGAGSAYRQSCMDRWKEKVVDTWGADLDPDLNRL